MFQGFPEILHLATTRHLTAITTIVTVVSIRQTIIIFIIIISIMCNQNLRSDGLNLVSRQQKARYVRTGFDYWSFQWFNSLQGTDRLWFILRRSTAIQCCQLSGFSAKFNGFCCAMAEKISIWRTADFLTDFHNCVDCF